MDKLLEYYQRPHFKLHFKPEHYVHHQEFNGKWFKAKWIDIVSNSRGIKRIQYNTQKIRKYIIVDIDNDTLFNYEKLNIPKPNFIVKNRNKVGGHLFWVLDSSISHNYYLMVWEKIQKAFTIILNGDEKNRGFIGKNLYDDLNFEYIEIYPYEYNINALYKYVLENNTINNETLNKNKIKKNVITIKNTKNNKVNSTSRNCDIFNKSRHYIYKQIKSGLNKQDINNSLKNIIEKINNSFTTPLEDNELIRIHKSISKYCIKKWHKIKNSKKQEPCLCFNEGTSIRDKQIAGAKYTNEIRVQKTIFKIREAIKIMNRDNLNINISSIAKRINMTNVTVRKYKYLILENHQKIKLYFHNKKELEKITMFGKRVLLNIIKFGKIINKVKTEKVDSTVSYHYIYNPTMSFLNKLNLMIKRIT